MSNETPTAEERAAFERWLQDVQHLSSEWQEERNCYKDFPAHLAFSAWRASRTVSPPVATHRDALIKIRDRTRSDPADFETAFRDLREIYTLSNMTLTDSGDLFTRPADETEVTPCNPSGG